MFFDMNMYIKRNFRCSNTLKKNSRCLCRKTLTKTNTSQVLTKMFLFFEN